MNLQLNQAYKESVIQMPNNLDNMIRRSGMLRKDVAKQMNIRPETVSRHCGGTLAISVDQAKHYGIILSCTAQEVLFAQVAAPLFGTLNDEIVTVRSTTKKQKAYYLPFPVTPSRRLILSKHTNPNKAWANGRFYSFNCDAIDKGEVEKSCFLTLSIVMVKDAKSPQFAVVYPEPGGTFSLAFNTDTHSTTDQSRVQLLDPSNKRSGLTLYWGTPILSCWFQADLLGIVEKEF